MSGLGSRLLGALLILSIGATGGGAAAPPRHGVTVGELRRVFPRAQLRRVTGAELREARERFAGRSVVWLDLPEGPSGPGPEPAPREAGGPPSETPGVSEQPSASPPERKFVHPGRHPRIDGSCLENLGGDGAEVLFVVIGVLVVAVLIVYAPVYLYKAATGEQNEYWWDGGVRFSFLAGGDRGTLTGVKVAGGLAEPWLQVGLVGEAGFLDLRLEGRDRGPSGGKRASAVRGAYGLVGPTVRLVDSQSEHAWYGYLELLAGASDERRLGMISVARVGASLGFGEHLRLGLSLGSIYTHLRKTDALVRQSEFGYIFGVDAGYRF